LIHIFVSTGLLVFVIQPVRNIALNGSVMMKWIQRNPPHSSVWYLRGS